MKGDPRIEIGGIARAHGIKGEVAIVTHDPESTILERAESLWVDGIEHKIVEARPTPKGWLVALAGVDTRNEAEALRGLAVEVAREALDLEEGDVVLNDLVGCKAVLPDGTVWGEIVAIDVGMQGLLVVHHGTIERLLPLVDEFVVNIDLDHGVVVVDPPEGLPESSIGSKR
jgi:16S rRNA processing protein RimM